MLAWIFICQQVPVCQTRSHTSSLINAGVSMVVFLHFLLICRRAAVLHTSQPQLVPVTFVVHICSFRFSDIRTRKSDFRVISRLIKTRFSLRRARSPKAAFVSFHFSIFFLFFFFLHHATILWQLPREDMSPRMAVKCEICLGLKTPTSIWMWSWWHHHWLALLLPSFHLASFSFFMQPQSSSPFHINTLVSSLSPLTSLTCTFPVTHSFLIPFNPLLSSKICPTLTPPSLVSPPLLFIIRINGGGALLPSPKRQYEGRSAYSKLKLTRDVGRTLVPLPIVFFSSFWTL